MLREDAYYERSAKRYCELMGIRADGLVREGNWEGPTWVTYARELKREDAMAQAKKETALAMANEAKAAAKST